MAEKKQEPQQLSPERQVIAAALDVLLSVNPALLDRNARQIDRDRGAPVAATLVSPYALLRLVQAIEQHFPGALAHARELSRCAACGKGPWVSHRRCAVAGT